MPEQTSIDAYRQAIEDGTISKARANVLQAAAMLGPDFSQADVCKLLGSTPTDFRRFAPRVRELEMMGVFAASGTKVDPVSGHNVKTYVITGRPPLPIPARIPVSVLHRKLYDYLKDDPNPEAQALVEQLRQSLKIVRAE